MEWACLRLLTRLRHAVSKKPNAAQGLAWQLPEGLLQTAAGVGEGQKLLDPWAHADAPKGPNSRLHVRIDRRRSGLAWVPCKAKHIHFPVAEIVRGGLCLRGEISRRGEEFSVERAEQAFCWWKDEVRSARIQRPMRSRRSLASLSLAQSVLRSLQVI